MHLVCRSRERGETAQKQIVEKTGNKDVHLLVADMSSVSDVRPRTDSRSHRTHVCLLTSRFTAAWLRR